MMLLTGLLIVALDQISKYFIISEQKFYILNHGFSFGFGQGIGGWVLVIFLALVIADSIKHGLRVLDIFVIAGGFSNILDRFFHGGVVDWIKISTLWFNFADVSITIGALWILTSFLRTSRS